MQVVGSAVGDDEPLMSAGLDSLGSVEFANVLSQKLGMQMPGTLVFDYPSVSSVTDYLTGIMLKQAAAAGAAASEGSESEGAELALHGDDVAGALAPADWAPRQRHLAILAVVTRPLMADALATPDQVRRSRVALWDCRGLPCPTHCPHRGSSSRRAYAHSDRPGPTCCFVFQQPAG